MSAAACNCRSGTPTSARRHKAAKGRAAPGACQRSRHLDNEDGAGRGNIITFDIDDGVSQSWGTFGQGVIATVPTTLTNLNAYSPLVSVDGSGVGFSNSRVTSLKLKKVTVHLSTGQIVVDNTVRVAYPKEQ